MALISGTLKNASGVRSNTKIILKSIKSTIDVLNHAPDYTVVTDADGKYSFECAPSLYSVTISQSGMPRENVGVIHVYYDTQDTDINTLILCPVEDLTPELVKQFEQLKNEAQQAALSAESSAKKAQEEVEKIDTDAIIANAVINSVSRIGARMKIKRDSNGNDNVMISLPCFSFDDIGMSDLMGSGVHPAFLRANGSIMSEIMVGAFTATNISNNAVVRGGFMPWVNIDFDSAKAKCSAMGNGWHMMTAMEWSAVALWCLANGFQPGGNTEYGRNHADKSQVCQRNDGKIPNDRSGPGIGLCGSGSEHWRHDGFSFGISDLVGNVWEWIDGVKLVNNEFHISTYSRQQESEWIATSIGVLGAGGPWSGIKLTGANDTLKQMLIDPIDATKSLIGTFYYSETGETMLARGGDWTGAGNCGLAAANMTNNRNAGNEYYGFRPVWSV